MAWLKGLLSLCFLLANTIFVCVPLFAMALLRIPLTGAWRSGLTRRMDGVIDLWVSSNRFLIRGLRLVDLEIHWPAEPLSRHNWYVVICNHQTWADILLLQHAFLAAIPPLKFFTKRELIWLPLAGPAMYVLGFPYVRRTNKAKLAANPALKYADRDSTLAACAGFRNHPTSVLIFLEGTRFTDTKRNARNSRFQHLLNPRTGGLGYLLSGLKDELRQMIDVTIAYPSGPPTFWDFLQGKCKRAHMTIQAVTLNAATRSAEQQIQREALSPLVEGLWRAKDERLGTQLGGRTN